MARRSPLSALPPAPNAPAHVMTVPPTAARSRRRSDCRPGHRGSGRRAGRPPAGAATPTARSRPPRVSASDAVQVRKCTASSAPASAVSRRSRRVPPTAPPRKSRQRPRREQAHRQCHAQPHHGLPVSAASWTRIADTETARVALLSASGAPRRSITRRAARARQRGCGRAHSSRARTRRRIGRRCRTRASLPRAGARGAPSC